MCNSSFQEICLRNRGAVLSWLYPFPNNIFAVHLLFLSLSPPTPPLQDRESSTAVIGHGGHGVGGGGQHNQMHQQQMVGQMQMAPMGAFGGQQFAQGGGGMMGQQMGHMQQQMHQQQMSGGGMPQATGNRIYVGNLAWTVEWQELKDHMRTVGKVVHADVLQDGDGRSKVGFGWGWSGFGTNTSKWKGRGVGETESLRMRVRAYTTEAYASVSRRL